MRRLLSRLRRKPPALTLDRTGPATAYPHRAGAYTRRTAWQDEPTELLPITTRAAIHRGGGHQ